MNEIINQKLHTRISLGKIFVRRYTNGNVGKAINIDKG